MSTKVIQIVDLSKKYQLGRRQVGSLRQSLSGYFTKKETKDFWALKKVCFEVQKGEVLGIIGANGAGKSTLLKILSRITYPTSGYIRLQGRVSSLLEVGTGFHPELTGRENIFLNGSLLGMKKAEIKTKFDEIVDFAGIDYFIDTPVKYYSSGMYVRLAFSVAAHLDSDILLIDEVLAVGDIEFQKKCLGKMQNLSSADGRTVLFVSHNLGAVSSMCNKIAVLHQGKLLGIGDTKLIEKYTKLIQSNANGKNNCPELLKVYWADSSLNPVIIIKEGDAAHLILEFDKNHILLSEPFNLTLAIDTEFGARLYSLKYTQNSIKNATNNLDNLLVVRFDKLSLKRGFYRVSILLEVGTKTIHHTDIHTFQVHPGDFHKTGAIEKKSKALVNIDYKIWVQ